jgi:hypothetical protein
MLGKERVAVDPGIVSKRPIALYTTSPRRTQPTFEAR